MKDLFISIYYNYNEYKVKEKLCEEFIAKHPDIHLIEVAYNEKEFVINHSNTTQLRKYYPGFINNELINHYLLNHWNEVNSLTIIDCDLDLEVEFFNKIKLKVKESKTIPTIIQGFSLCVDKNYFKKIRGQSIEVVHSPLNSCIKQYKQLNIFDESSHTGYIYTFNKKAIELLYPLPTYLILGSFDYILCLCLTKQKELLRNLINEESITLKLLEFYNKCEGINCDYIDSLVVHNYHGDKRKRYQNRFKLYECITKDVVRDYFESRDEDN